MNKSVLSIIIMLILCVGCSSQKEKAIEKLKPVEEEDYNVVVFTDETPSLEYQREVNDIEPLWGDHLNSFSYKVLREGEPSGFDYESIFNIQNYPTIMVFNSDGIALKTNSIKELENFFAKISG